MTPTDTRTNSPSPEPQAHNSRTPERGAQPVTEALALCVAARVPVMLWGDPGIGKTATMQAIASQLAAADPEFVFETIIASLHEPADFGGYPVADLATGTARHLAPEWATRIAGRNGLLFLDEFSTAPPAVQAACLRLLAERVIGGTDLGDGVAIVLAANPVSSAAAGWDLSPAVSRRFVHLHFGVSTTDVIDGIAHGFTPPAVPDLTAVASLTDRTGAEPGHPALRPSNDARVRVATYLDANRAAVIDVPSDPGHTNGAWPNPAAWERLTVLLTAADAAGTSEESRRLLIEGCVGEHHGHGFLRHDRYADLPSAEALLVDPTLLELCSDKPDRLHVALASVRLAVADTPTPPRWAAAWRVAAHACATSEGAATTLARWLAANIPEGSDPALPEIHRFAPVLREAGLIGAAA